MKNKKRKIQKWLFSQLCLLLALMNIPTLAIASINIMDVKIIEEDVEIKINIITDKPVIKYNSFSINNPPSIVIEFQDAQCSERELNIGRNGINKINLIPQEGNKVKAVFNLIKLLPYQVQKLPNGLKVIIENPYHEYQISTINVKEDESKIKLEISSTAPPQYKYFDLSNPNRIILDFLNATNKIGKVDVTSKVIKNIIPTQRQVEPVNVARVIVELTEWLPYDVFSEENQVIVELTKSSVVKEIEKIITPPTPKLPIESLPQVKEIPSKIKEHRRKPQKEEKPKAEKVVKKPSEPKQPLIIPKSEAKELVEEISLSLDFKDADIHDVLRLIAHKVGMNVLPGKEVKGVVTVKLEDVPWRKALDLILKNQGYAYIIEGNVIRVDTPTYILGDTITQIFKLNYAKAADMASIVTNILTTLASQQAKRMGGATPVLGTVIQDARTNALIVTDIPYNISQVEEMIKKLDTITPQVMIEARIVEVTLNNQDMFGFRWGIYEEERDSQQKGHQFTLGSYQTEGWATGDRGEFVYAKISNMHKIDLEIQALVSEGKANVLSAPKILALDNEPANIVVGQDLPYKQTTKVPAGEVMSNVSFRSVGVKLRVVPHVNPDNFILLDVKPEVSSLSGWSEGAPIVNTKQADCKLVVKDGETVLIGGIIDDQGTEKINKVPFFGDLPFIGPLFRKKITTNYKKELLIFITPYIKKYA